MICTFFARKTARSLHNLLIHLILKSMDVNITPEVRQKVVAWVNSKSKDLSSGLEILAETGYKPHVCANFVANQKRQDIPKKLENELRLYLRYYANPASDIHKDAEPEKTEAEKAEFLGNIEKEIMNEEYPAIIKMLLIEFSTLYKGRSIMHQSLKATGEDNSKKVKAERVRLMFVMDACSRRMDDLWKAHEAYKADGTLPEATLFAETFDPSKITPPVEVEKEITGKIVKTAFIMAIDLPGLKKQSDGWRIKISKAENKLNYQDEKKPKDGVLKPMPEGPKRILQEKRIAQLKSEKEQIELQIANLK